MKLYEIMNDIDKWFWVREHGTPEERNAAYDELCKLQGTLDEKLGNMGRLLLNMRAESEAIKAEEIRLKERRWNLDSRMHAITEYVANCIGEGSRWADDILTFSWRRSEAVEITDEAALPADYWRVKTIKEPAKDLIKDVLKGGAEIPGARLEVRQNLQIK